MLHWPFYSVHAEVAVIALVAAVGRSEFLFSGSSQAVHLHESME